MTAQDTQRPEDFIALLHQFLEKSKAKNARFSQRSFAKLLGTDNSRLSKIMRRERPIHPELVEKIGAKLKLEQADIDHYKMVEAMKYRRGQRKKDTPRTTYKQIPQDVFKVISDMNHYMILELMNLRSFETDPRWIAEKLQLSIDTVKDCIARLERTGLLIIEPSGAWKDNTGGVSTDILGPNRASQAHRENQKDILKRAQSAVDKLSLERRDQSSMMVSSNAEKIAGAKKMITSFRRKLARYLDETTDKDQIYMLSISLFPALHNGEKTL